LTTTERVRRIGSHEPKSFCFPLRFCRLATGFGFGTVDL
jgi:hypothetical protein